MNTQFASKASAFISSLDPNLKVYQASFQPYRPYDQNDDRTVVLKTDYGCIVGVLIISIAIV